MNNKLLGFKNYVLLGVVFFMLHGGVVFAQTEITVEPGFNTLLDAVTANPGSTFILQRGGDYVIDREIVVDVPTIFKGEKEPAATKPAVVSYFADPGLGAYMHLFSVAANCTFQDFGMLGFTYDEQQIGSVTNIIAPNITVITDGCYFQEIWMVQQINGLNKVKMIMKNNKFFNLANIGWDNWGGEGTEWGGDSIDYQNYNNTYFVCGRTFNAGGSGPNGSELMEHNSYVLTWGDVFFPTYNKDYTVKNNLFYDSQVRGYVGKRKAANGDLLWAGDYSDWTNDSICGDISIFPHLADSVGDIRREVSLNNNLRMYSSKVTDFYAANNVTPQTFFNVSGYKYAERYGWNIKDNILQEKGNTVNPQFAMGLMPDAAYEIMFKQRIERSLPAAMRGPDFPYYLAWLPGGVGKGEFIWPLPYDLKPMNTALWKAGDDGYPLGDLNWFGPEIVAAWEAGLVNPLVINGIGEIKSAEFNLKNYPNPFNSSTLISYTLPIQNKVSLKVFNSTGSEVATLVDATQSAGNHDVTFNSANLSQGMYYYKIQVGELSQLQKMILVK